MKTIMHLQGVKEKEFHFEIEQTLFCGWCHKGKIAGALIVRGVPVFVCRSCHERYFPGKAMDTDP